MGVDEIVDVDGICGCDACVDEDEEDGMDAWIPVPVVVVVVPVLAPPTTECIGPYPCCSDLES